jgi:hypothetical protein
VARAGDPVVGTWVLNLGKSQFSPGPAPQEEVRTYMTQGGGIKVTVITTGADGRSTTVNISANYDGKDYPVTGAADYDAIELKKVNEFVSAANLLHGSKVIASSRREVSEDGRTMTITYNTSAEQERQIHNRAVYNKQ